MTQSVILPAALSTETVNEVTNAVDDYSVKQLKEAIAAQGGSYAGLVEKRELYEHLKQLLRTADSGNTCATMPPTQWKSPSISTKNGQAQGEWFYI